MTQITTLPFARAQELVDRALALCDQQGLRAAVVVVDVTATPVAVARMDGAFPSTVAVATAKALTALNFGANTKVLRERIVPGNQQALASVDPRLMFVGGGAPVMDGGTVVGAVGVSGGSEDQDHELAVGAIGARD